MYLRLDDVKAHLNVELEYTGDDLYILGLTEAAESLTSKNLNIDFKRRYVDESDMPPDIKMMIKILVATWFNNREAIGNSNGAELPLSFRYLLMSNFNPDDTAYYAIKKL